MTGLRASPSSPLVGSTPLRLFLRRTSMRILCTGAAMLHRVRALRQHTYTYTSRLRVRELHDASRIGCRASTRLHLELLIYMLMTQTAEDIPDLQLHDSSFARSGRGRCAAARDHGSRVDTPTFDPLACCTGQVAASSYLSHVSSSWGGVTVSAAPSIRRGRLVRLIEGTPRHRSNTVSHISVTVVISYDTGSTR